MHRATVNCKLSTALSFRFRRWSRRGYAAFFSLGRTVTIGQLSANVSERFQAKNASHHSVANLFEFSCKGEDDSIGNQNELVAEAIPELMQTIFNCLPAVKTQTAAAAWASCPNKNSTYYSDITEGSRHKPVAFRFFMSANKPSYDN